MLKFKSNEDRIQFLVDVGKLEYLDIKEDALPLELSELFFNTNKLRTHAIVDFKKAQFTKHQWNTNRWAMMKGIHQFHRSIEGKRLHRSMGRFLATRIFEPGRMKALPSLRSEAAKALSSVRTHFYIESQYYRPLLDDVDFELLFEYSIPLLASSENKVYENHVEDINPDELELLFRITSFQETAKAFLEYDEKIDIDENAILETGTYFLTEKFCKSTKHAQ